MSDVLLAAVKGFLYTSFATNLQWMLKSVITSVFMIGWIINLLISFNGSLSLHVILFKNVLFATWKDIPARQRGVSKETVITVCHTVLWYSLLKMMAEIKYNPLGKGQMANNCIWPLSKNAHSQLPFITSSYILPGGPEKSSELLPCARARGEHHRQPLSWQLLCPDKTCNKPHATLSTLTQTLLQSLFNMICSSSTQVLIKYNLEKMALHLAA